MNKFSRLLVISALLASIPAICDARKSDFSQAIDVKADRSVFDEKSGIQLLEGNVRITQGTMKISADKISVGIELGKLSTIKGTGNPIIFEQENEEGESVIGRCQEIEYDAVKASLVLIGNASLKQPNQELTGQRIEFDSKNQKVRADGGNKGRVSITIQPPKPEKTQ